MVNKKNKDNNIENTSIADHFTHIGERAVVYNNRINKDIE